MQELGTLPGLETSIANGISADGSTVVGTASTLYSPNHRAFIWRQASGMQDLTTVLLSVLPSGWQVTEANAASADGTFIVGTATDTALKPHAFLANVPSCVAASVVTQPVGGTPCTGQPYTLSVTAGGNGPLHYQWERDGVAISGATSSQFSFTTASHADSGVYDCIVSGGCGTTRSVAASLSFCACISCAADFNQDGGVDGADVSDFFSAWEQGSCDADVDHNGGTDGDDVSTFFTAWENGGC
jgi:probable HAF family extracellular repeat protein